MRSKLLITGVNGYLGLHMAIQGLNEGYAIRGTVRSQDKANHCKNYLSKLIPKEQFRQFETVNVDLSKPNGWDQAIKGCDAILHTASPLSTSSRIDKMRMVKTVRDGVKHIFQAALRQNVTRIIYTSSVAAAMFGHNRFKSNYCDEDWSIPSGKPNTHYTLSKTLAERDAWGFAGKFSDLKLTSIMPGLVLGPINNSISLSTELVLGLMSGAFSKGVINRDFPIVDVRDVVSAHLKSLQNNQSIGQRIMLAGHCLHMQEIAETLLSYNPQFKSAINPKLIPTWQLKIFSFFSTPLRQLILEANISRSFNNNKALELLGIRLRDPRESLVATAKDLVRLGLVAANV